ncbi:MAG: hypothetical protein ACMUIE_02080 [Thermoplasmatota archaeon]
MKKEEPILALEMSLNHPLYFALTVSLFILMWGAAAGLSIVWILLGSGQGIAFFILLFVAVTFFLFIPLMMISDFYPYYLLVYQDRIEVIKRNTFRVHDFVKVIYSLEKARYSYPYMKGIHIVDESRYRVYLVRIKPGDKELERKEDLICRALATLGIEYIDDKTHKRWIDELSRSSKEMKAETTGYQTRMNFGGEYEYGIMKVETENVRRPRM